jgi:Cu(I)/Ag(I) efflux system protein CusF
MGICSRAQPRPAPAFIAHGGKGSGSVLALTPLDAISLVRNYAPIRPSRETGRPQVNRLGYPTRYGATRSTRVATTSSNRREHIMKRIRILGLLVTLFAVVPTAAFAQTSDTNKPGTKSMDMKSMDSKAMDMKGMWMDRQTSSMTHDGTGVVKSVNAADGVVTVAHEPIKSLSWPSMTMGFKVKDKSLLSQVKPGDKVQFTLVQTGKDYVITSMK